MNKITASVHFYYKGKPHSPFIEIDATDFINKALTDDKIYRLIAQANHYDFYSYEFEMMQAESIIYSGASGFIAKYIKDGRLDVEAFKNAWAEKEALKNLSIIAKELLCIENLEENTAIKKALLKAYKLGISHKNN